MYFSANAATCAENSSGEVAYEAVGTFWLPQASQPITNADMTATDAITIHMNSRSSRGKRRAQPGGWGATEDSCREAMATASPPEGASRTCP